MIQRIRHGRRLLVSAVVYVSAVIATAPPALATTHGHNGRIAFRRFLNAEHTRGALFTIKPDGTGLRQVTRPGRRTITTNPNWSPNGRWIAYSIYAHADEDHSRIYKIHPDGTGRTYLSGSCTGRCVTDDSAAWGPHGKRIAFQRGLAFAPGVHNTFVFVMRADGTHPRRITQRGANPALEHHFADLAPAWSPTGKRLAFERADQIEAGGRSNHHAIFTVRLDGTGLRRITPWALDAAQPDWSPNGRWILFRSHEPSPTAGNIWLVHPDGTGRHRVTHDFGGSGKWLRAAFSPNGQKITAARTNGVGKAGNADVYVMNIDGSGLQNITRSTQWESTPDWGRVDLPRQGATPPS
jgi:TolB protein